MKKFYNSRADNRIIDQTKRINENGTGLVVKSATWYTISSMLIKSVSLITAPIFTRLLSTADYGVVSNFSTWVLIADCFTGLGLAYAVARGKIEFSEEYPQYISSIQTLSLISTGIWVFGAILFSRQIAELMEISRILVVIMFIYLVSYPSIGFAQTNYRFEYKYKRNILISVINTLANVVFSIGLILVFNDQRYIGRILGMILPILIMGSYFCIRILRKGRCYVEKKYWKYALKISIPMIPHGLAMIVLAQIDRVMIIKLCGDSEAGIYSFGYSYAIVISMLTNAINDALQPTIYQNIKAGNEKKINNMTHCVCIGVTFVAFAIAMVGPEAIKILGTRDYYNAVWVICPVVFGAVFQLMYQNYSLVEMYYKKTIIIAIGSIIAAFINIVFNYIFIMQYGYLAAGWTTLLGYVFLMIFHFVGAMIVGKKRIFSLRNLVFESVLLFSYSMSLKVRFIIFIFVILMVLLRYKDVIKVYLQRKERI